MGFIDEVNAFRSSYDTWCASQNVCIGDEKILSVVDGVEKLIQQFRGGVFDSRSLDSNFYRLFFSLHCWLDWYCLTIRNVLFELEGVFELLVAKNHDYGNSALQVPMLLPSTTPADAILVRLSDKLSRLDNLAHGASDSVGEPLEDTLVDVVGYLILYWIAIREENSQE